MRTGGSFGFWDCLGRSKRGFTISPGCRTCGGLARCTVAASAKAQRESNRPKPRTMRIASAPIGQPRVIWCADHAPSMRCVADSHGVTARSRKIGIASARSDATDHPTTPADLRATAGGCRRPEAAHREACALQTGSRAIGVNASAANAYSAPSRCWQAPCPYALISGNSDAGGCVADGPGSVSRGDTTGKTRRLFCPTSQARFAKIILFPNYRTYDLKKPSRPHEGRNAIVTIRGAGCDGRRSAQTMRACAYGQAVWSCPPDAGVKPIEMRFRPCGRNAEIGDGG